MLKYSAWLDASKFEDKILSAVVRYPFKPSNECLPESPLRYNKTDLIEGVFTDFLHGATSTKSRDVAFWSRLKNDEAFVGAVPGWISLLNTWPPCLVVGIMTAEDVELDFTAIGSGLNNSGSLSRDQACLNSRPNDATTYV
ncbi:hypothetical protein F5Y09DRAFT_344787 [Xylaria sp. FL1042]|nr:hypothetical protein F5Y09DRAFT_344787 [Xylaria sp. FL1042]